MKQHVCFEKKNRLTFSSSSSATSAARGLCQLVLRMRVSRRGAPLTSSILAFPWWQMSKVTVCWVSSQVALTVKQFCNIYRQINNFPYLQKSLKNHPFTIFIYYTHSFLEIFSGYSLYLINNNNYIITSNTIKLIFLEYISCICMYLKRQDFPQCKRC